MNGWKLGLAKAMVRQFLLIAALILPALPLAAQQTASISGSVSDQTGAVVAGAVVALSGAAGTNLTATSDAQGNYKVKDLPPGTYTMTVSAPGFKLFRSDNLTLTFSQELALDVSLEPAGETTNVTVEEHKTAEVETENAEVSGTITQKELVTLGLNGRNFTQLITLAPGVSNQTGQDEAKVGVLGSCKVQRQRWTSRIQQLRHRWKRRAECGY